MDWMDFNRDGEVDVAGRFFEDEMFCASKERHEAIFGDAGYLVDECEDEDE